MDELSTVIVLDIEGTMTTLSFVKDVLFGYVREHLKSFEDEEVLKKCKEEWKTEKDVKKHALALMDEVILVVMVCSCCCYYSSGFKGSNTQDVAIKDNG